MVVFLFKVMYSGSNCMETLCHVAADVSNVLSICRLQKMDFSYVYFDGDLAPLAYCLACNSRLG